MAVRVELLADHLGRVDTLARLHCDEAGRGEDPHCLRWWQEQLRQECGRERIPIAFVALDGSEAVGHVSLVEQNMDTHRELSPWLAGTLVQPSRRGEGVGIALVRRAVEQAGSLGIARLYLFTETATGFYERLGWSRLADEVYEGGPVAVMYLDLG